MGNRRGEVNLIEQKIFFNRTISSLVEYFFNPSKRNLFLPNNLDPCFLKYILLSYLTTDVLFLGQQPCDVTN